MSNIKDVVNQIKENPEQDNNQKPRFYTGSTLRDLVLGGAKGVLGIQAGVIWNSIGDSSAGKTFEACELIATNRKIYKDRFKWNYDDAEGGNSIDAKSLYGFDILTTDSMRSATVEDLFINIHKFVASLGKDELGIYVLDSLDAITSKEIKDRGEARIQADEKGKDFKEGSYLMGKQKYLSTEFFPVIKPLIEASNCLLVIISQEKEKIGITFGSRSTRAGGIALQFFCHFESWVARAEMFEVTKKGERRVLGIRNKMRFSKARNGRPFRDSYATIYFDYGIDDLSSNLDFLFNLLTPQGANKTDSEIPYLEQDFLNEEEFWEYIQSTLPKSATEKRIQEIKDNKKSWKIAKIDLIHFIEQHNLEQKLKDKVIEKWEEIEDAIKIERKSKY